MEDRNEYLIRLGLLTHGTGRANVPPHATPLMKNLIKVAERRVQRMGLDSEFSGGDIIHDVLARILQLQLLPDHGEPVEVWLYRKVHSRVLTLRRRQFHRSRTHLTAHSHLDDDDRDGISDEITVIEESIGDLLTEPSRNALASDLKDQFRCYLTKVDKALASLLDIATECIHTSPDQKGRFRWDHDAIRVALGLPIKTVQLLVCKFERHARIFLRQVVFSQGFSGPLFNS